MKSLPVISLVTPSFNQARYIGAMFESVAAQNYPRLEHVVVDGGSTDGAAEVIRSRQAELAWWCSEADGGLYDALNKGFARTTGDIMGWLNSDDLLLPRALLNVAEIFASFPDVQWISSLALSTHSTTGQCLGVSLMPGYSREAFAEGRYLPGSSRLYGFIPQESTFWRRGLWERAGARLDSSLSLAGDYELWTRFYRHAELVGTPSPIAGFRVQPAQKSRALAAYIGEARRIARGGRTAGAIRRSILLRTRLSEMPGLRGVLANRFGYRGTFAFATPDGAWRLESRAFL